MRYWFKRALLRARTESETLRNRHSGFARGVEEGERDDFCGNVVADGVDGHFDAEGVAVSGVSALDAGEGNHLF